MALSAFFPLYRSPKCGVKYIEYFAWSREGCLPAACTIPLHYEQGKNSSAHVCNGPVRRFYDSGGGKKSPVIPLTRTHTYMQRKS